MTTLALAAMFAAAGAAPAPTNAELAEQVRQTETAFAKTMADRDHAAFVSFLSEETVWFGRGVLRGKKAVADAWKPYYDGAKAPFSWRPEHAEVLDSGTLGFTSGPVFDPSGKRTGTFNSVWRREADGKWRIAFDNGCPRCDCAASPAPAPSPKPSPGQ
jgi:ketosteroid isomerase-like protein